MFLITNSVILLAVTTVLLCIIWYNWTRRHLYRAATKFNGPFALPLIGNATICMGKSEDILMKMYNITKHYVFEPMRIWLGPTLLVIFVNPDHVEKILSSQKFAQKHDIYEFVKIYLGEGLVSGSGPNYKQHRRIIQPMFAQNFAVECTGVIQKHVDLCMDKLEKVVDKGTFNLHSFTHKCMVDIIKETILGSQEQTQLTGLSDFDRATMDAYDLTFQRIAKPWLQPDVLFNMTAYKKKQDMTKAIFRKRGQSMVEASIIRRKNKIINDFYPIIDRIIDHMEDNPGAISDMDLIDNLLTLYVAAEDTYTIISGFMTMCLGMYPEYQEKAAKEIKEIFGETPRPVTFEDIKKLNYINMCFKDVLRLFPIAPIIIRKCSENFELDKWFIPKGCAIAIPIFTIHRDKRYWENPYHFHPDHFLPEVADKRHVYAYVPFSAGPRGCIGKHLAHVGIKLFICSLLQRFEIEADGKVPDLDLKMDISTRPKKGYFVRLKKRVWK